MYAIFDASPNKEYFVKIGEQCMLRNGYYGKYKDNIYPITILQNKGIVYVMSDDFDDFHKGFEKNKSYSEVTRFLYHKYYKSVEVSAIEWFCRIKTYGYYKGYKVWISGETYIEYSICSGPVSADQKVFTKENGFQEMDRYLFIGEVPKNEITGIFEIKTPINENYKAPDNWDF